MVSLQSSFHSPVIKKGHHPLVENRLIFSPSPECLVTLPNSTVQDSLYFRGEVLLVFQLFYRSNFAFGALALFTLPSVGLPEFGATIAGAYRNPELLPSFSLEYDEDTTPNLSSMLLEHQLWLDAASIFSAASHTDVCISTGRGPKYALQTSFRETLALFSLNNPGLPRCRAGSFPQ